MDLLCQVVAAAPSWTFSENIAGTTIQMLGSLADFAAQLAKLPDGALEFVVEFRCSLERPPPNLVGADESHDVVSRKVALIPNGLATARVTVLEFGKCFAGPDYIVHRMPREVARHGVFSAVAV